MSRKEIIREWANNLEQLDAGKSYKPYYLKYVSNLAKYNLPIIFEIEHLAALLERNPKFVRQVSSSSNAFYINFQIPKRLGGYREISSPYPSLLECQQWISKNILRKVRVSEIATAYSEGCSPYNNAMHHVKKNQILRLDIKNFFPSITKTQVTKLFGGLGYAPSVSEALSSICCYRQVLPQGGATSPAISNILCFNLDNALIELANKYETECTRYADDITFSGDFIDPKMILEVHEIVSRHGFELNTQKTSIVSGSARKIVTGLCVNGDFPRIPRSYRRQLKKEAYHLITKGIDGHFSKAQINDILYVERIIGKLNYWKQIEPNNKFAYWALTELRANYT